jgi:hypothetical protein
MSHEQQPTQSTRQFVKHLTKQPDADITFALERLAKEMGRRNGEGSKRGASVPKLPVVQQGV